MILHCIYVSLFFIHLLVDWHLDWFHSFAVVNHAAISMGVQLSLLYVDLHSLRHLPKNDMQDNMIVLFLVFGGTSLLTSIVVTLIYISTNSV
jgi:hypothetical protein